MLNVRHGHNVISVTLQARETDGVRSNHGGRTSTDLTIKINPM